MEAFCRASIEASSIKRTESCLYGTFWAGLKYLYLANGLFIKKVPVLRKVFRLLLSSKIVSKAVTATGCTSQGQAHRFGKWHLLTEKLEKEIVSFSTGLNAIALRPGDVIEIQDADLNETEHSGRVSNTGTRNTTTIPLDREISLNTSTKAYKLNLIFPKISLANLNT